MAKITFAGPSQEELIARSKALCVEFKYEWLYKKLKEYFPESKPQFRKVDYDNDLLVTVDGYSMRLEQGVPRSINGLSKWSLNNAEEKADFVLNFIDTIKNDKRFANTKQQCINSLSTALRVWKDAPEDWVKMTRETLGKMGVIT